MALQLSSVNKFFFIAANLSAKHLKHKSEHIDEWKPSVVSAWSQKTNFSNFYQSS